MTRQALIAGGGIGGLAAALAAARAGWNVRLFERADAFSEIGAGVQLGPNVVRVLQEWGLASALQAVAACPARLQVRSARSGGLLATLTLGGWAHGAMVARYGAPYLTLHRADLHAILLHAVQQTRADLHLGCALQGFAQTPQAVSLRTHDGLQAQGDLLVGADGVWSSVRQQLLGDGLPQRTGHLAYRALVPQAGLPARLRSGDVTVWLGPRMHLVHYPVRGGDWLNVVAIVHGELPDGAASWDHVAHAADLMSALAGSCPALLERVAALEGWRLWALYDRPPMQGAFQHAAGRVALLGDAAHPMRPYLAQGAGMAVEDAHALGQVLAQAPDPATGLPELLQRFAHNRWQRNARVQARALRNGRIFHAGGPLRLARDTALRVLGKKLLDIPWLYAGPGQRLGGIR